MAGEVKMSGLEQRKHRLTELLELAQAAHGWSRRRLARALGRDASKLVPESGVPKLDLVVRLADVLGWPLRDIVDHLWRDEGTHRRDHSAEPMTFATLNAEAREAHRRGRYAELVDRARRAYVAAATSLERACACNREVGGWDGMGCYADALEAARRGLREREVPADVRRMLQANLANAYYGMGLLPEARCVAGELVSWYAGRPPEALTDRVAQAFAYYVLGNTHHRQMGLDLRRSEKIAAGARRELATAVRLCEGLAQESGDACYSGIANTCRGALLEVDVVLGRQHPGAALRSLAEGLDAVVDCTDWDSGDWLESFGWWCIFGCNVALRSEDRERDAQQYTAIFTNKADEIAERLDNWSLRERVVSIEYARWSATEPHVLDAEDVRKIMGAMGRFPAFRPIGWRLLESAGLAHEN
ncbi:MAG: hypothetical protein GY715_22045 [Planctomycetes bacterium]|nr:hypothetical protein [Planctomycetota bacterium]